MDRVDAGERREVLFVASAEWLDNGVWDRDEAVQLETKYKQNINKMLKRSEREMA